MIPMVKPEEVGFSSSRLTAVSNLVHQYMKTGLLPGAVALIARHGKLVLFNAYGKMDIENDKPMREESIFRIYSMTKPITAAALLILYEQGYFQLSDPISRYIPSFKDLRVLDSNGSLVTQKREATIHDLLIHAAGFSHPLHGSSSIGALYRASSLLNLRSGMDLKSFVEKLSHFPLAFHPGAYWHYSISYNVLSYLIEHFSGMPFDEWIAKKISGPLGMLDTTFHVPKHKASRLSVLYAHEESALKRLFESDEILIPPQFLSGGGGLVSTAADYLRFCQMLINQGVLDGTRILSRKSIELMTSQHLSGDLSQTSLLAPPEIGLTGIGYGLGVGVVLDPAQAQIVGTKGSYFWSGIANTSFFVDPQEKLIGLFLTQVKTANRFYPFQRDFRVAVYQALND